MTSGETILVAEDDPEVLKITCKLLEKLGYRVIAASDGEEAVRLFEQMPESIDMLLFDALMPKLCGYSAGLQIREKRANLPLLFFTAYCDEISKEEMEMLSSHDILQKPLRINHLAEVVRHVFD